MGLRGNLFGVVADINFRIILLEFKTFHFGDKAWIRAINSYLNSKCNYCNKEVTLNSALLTVFDNVYNLYSVLNLNLNLASLLLGKNVQSLCLIELII